MNKQGSENVSFIDDVFGGNDSHSRTGDADTESQNSKEIGAEQEPESNAKDEEPENPEDNSDSFDDDDFDAEGDDFSEDDDNSESEPKTDEKPRQKAPDAAEIDSEKLKQEIETLQKRLHDTQAAMHKATTDRAALKKELDELKAKKENEDDWFSEDDSEREKELEANLKKADEDSARLQAEQDDLKKQEATKAWDAAAAPVIKAHPDFEKVMYEEFAPLLDPKTGNQQVLKEWNELKDKSPASAYEFAKQQLDIIEFQRDPKAYKEKLLKANKNNNSFEDDEIEDDEPRGKRGLDMLNSADVESSPPEWNGSFVDAVFG